MQPLSKEEKGAIIEAFPDAEPGEIESEIAEYEQLLADIFAEDPEGPAAAPPTDPSADLLADPAVLHAAGPEPADRLRQLHAKLFGGGDPNHG